MDTSSTQKVALITGGTRGIGRGLAAAFLPDHRTALTYRSTPPGADLSEAALCIAADLGDPETAQSVIDAVISHYGRIDVLIHNAGAVAQTPADSFDAAAHRSQYDLHCLAPAALLAAALPHFTPGACFISISSVNAVLPPKGAVAYGASKAALNLWTRAMAKELGPSGIRVNGIAPGAIERIEAPRPPDLLEKFVAETALGRPGTPEDIAGVARFLASDAAGYITGETITVSGGYRL